MLARSNKVESESAVNAMNFSQMTISMSSVGLASSAVARAGREKLRHHQVAVGCIRHDNGAERTSRSLRIPQLHRENDQSSRPISDGFSVALTDCK